LKILIDIGHPAHVHLYRNLISGLKAKGVEVWVTVRNIDSAKRLLDLYLINYLEIGDKYDSLFSKMINQIVYDFRVNKIIRKQGIEIGIGSSIVLPHMSLLGKFTSIILDDDDDNVEPLFTAFAHPFATLIFSPDSLKGKRRCKRTVFYPGYHELTYLHPDIFKPDKNVLADAGLKDGEIFFIMRFNAFKAHHDKGIRGISLTHKLELIRKLEPHGTILITAERDIEPELKEYRLTIPPDKIHSLLSYATLFIGDSQTMTSEAAVLGTPALRMNSFAGRISYLEEEEKRYNLTFGFRPDQFNEMLAKIDDILALRDIKKEWGKRRDIMLRDKIDITGHLIRIIENYPDSIKLLKKNPNFYSI
jgi:uncharacterized protein